MFWKKKKEVRQPQVYKIPEDEIVSILELADKVERADREGGCRLATYYLWKKIFSCHPGIDISKEWKFVHFGTQLFI